MKILITGGAGFIGSSLALALIAKGHELTVLDNLSQQIHGDHPETESELYNKIAHKVIFIKGDVTNKHDWQIAIADNEVIVHLAAETGTGQSMYQIKKYTDVNMGGIALMLDLLANTKHQVKKIIIASSRAIYGEGKYFGEKTGFVFPLSRKNEDMLAGNFEVTYKDNIELLQQGYFHFVLKRTPLPKKQIFS